MKIWLSIRIEIRIRPRELSPSFAHSVYIARQSQTRGARAKVNGQSVSPGHSLTGELIAAALASRFVTDADDPCRQAIEEIGPVLVLGEGGRVFRSRSTRR